MLPRYFCRILQSAGKLTINAGKSKILILEREKRQYTLHLNGEILEKVRAFKYFGVMFTKKWPLRYFHET